MPDPTYRAEPAVEMLMTLDENKLFSELGLRLKTVENDPAKSNQFDLKPDTNAQALGLREDLVTFGKKFFNRVSAQAYSVICGGDHDDRSAREELMSAFGIGKDAVGPAIAILLVGHLGLAPAIASVVAALIIRLFFRPAHEAMCELWKGKLPENHK